MRSISRTDLAQPRMSRRLVRYQKYVLRFDPNRARVLCVRRDPALLH